MAAVGRIVVPFRPGHGVVSRVRTLFVVDEPESVKLCAAEAEWSGHGKAFEDACLTLGFAITLFMNEGFHCCHWGLP